MVRAGKALHIGASSMHAFQFAKLQALAQANGVTKFVTMQNKYNLLYREEEREMIPLCLDQGVGIIPYSPLARGLLAGSRRADTERSRIVKDFSRPEDDAVIDSVSALAKARGYKPAQVALAWLLHNPAVTAPILGATKSHHVDDAVAALDIQLTDQELDTLEAAYRPQQVQHDRNERLQPGQTAASDLKHLFRRSVESGA